MKLSRLLVSMGVIIGCAVWQPGDAFAQNGTHGSTEISVMHGFVLTTSSSHNSADITVIMTPVPPVWRLSFWTQTPITVDMGFSMLTAMSGGESVTVLNFEGGVGVNLARRDAKVVPFLSGVGGVVSFSASHENSESDPYVGAQFGTRTFIRDYAAVRVQAGFRHVFVKKEKDVDLFEGVAGLSFFL